MIANNDISTLLGTEVNWKHFNINVPVKMEGFHIFKILVDKCDEQVRSFYKDVLLEEELSKSHRFKHLNDAKKYLVTRFAIRNILSHFILVPPSKIEFHHSINKKPYVAGIEFNITHSGNIILIAIGTSAIGIDIELINTTFGYRPLLAACFDSREATFINSGSDLEKFFMLWTRKEAVLKASGEGVSDHMSLLNCLEDSILHKHTLYQLTSNLVDDCYVMSMATNTKNLQLNFWNYIKPFPSKII